jgi:FAD/FMN-containing dehydrogenase
MMRRLTMNLKEGLIEIVGKENFSDNPGNIETYSHDYSLTRGCRPHCIVRPKNTEQVQKIVRMAGETQTPIIPSSSKVHFHGSTVSKLGGIVIDLSGMNKILDIDERNRKVRIEPGVTWRQIEEELEKRELRVIIPLLPHSASSVLTSCLEREVPLVPIYEYGEPFGGAEVVWPNGDVFRTGSASVAGYPESGSKGANFEGPGINFIHLVKGAQGTMGIVTWANVKMEYLPKVNKALFSPFDDLEKAIRPLYRIQRLKIGHECFLMNHLNLALILAGGERKEFERLRAALPPWTLILILSGPRRRPEEKIELEERALMKMKNEEFREMKISTALLGVPGAGEKLQNLLRKPWPIEETYWKHFYKGGCEDLLFIGRLADGPKFKETVEKMAVRNGYSLKDLGCYLQPIEYARACHIEYNFYYERGNLKEIERVRTIKLEAAKLLLDQGAFFSRPYGELANMVYERAASYTSVLKKVKNIFDPNNIMNPGNLCF